MEKVSAEDIFNIENSILRLDRLVHSNYTFSPEKLVSFKFLLKDILEHIDRSQIVNQEICKNNITLNIRKEIKDELKDELKKEIRNELKTKSNLNLTIEEKFLRFMDLYCDSDPNKSIQASRLMRLYNTAMGDDVTVIRIGKIIRYVSEKRPISIKLKKDGTYYSGFDVKKEHLDENDNIIRLVLG